MILIGIDVGTNTGVAVMTDGVLTHVATTSIIGAMETVKEHIDYAKTHNIALKIYIEDARLRTWFGDNANAKKQGAGSVKRDSAIWEEFCVHYEADFTLVAPQHNKTKITADQFKRITGWQKRTSNHARDAVMLIWGRKWSKKTTDEIGT